MSIQDQMPRSPASRVRVNAGKIKFIRESKGLTQLYVATALGVATDTVSRWENAKYPTVKWENVEGLAKALDVDVAELLEPEEEGSGEALPGEGPAAGSHKRIFLVVSLAVLVLLAVGLFISNTRRETANITATRFLPMHITPGQPFPVVVRVESNGAQPFTFILEEKLPENFSVVRSLPEVASVASGDNTVKWIGSSRQTPFFLAYLVKTPSGLQTSGRITFTGRIKANDAPRFEQKVVGDSELVLSNYHWVDANSDGVIDDEEILTAFSSADVLRQLGVDMDRIKKIWSAGGYSWDQAKKQYQIIQQKEVER
jgi:transcriptional regulator with XRE-family HTH domain